MSGAGGKICLPIGVSPLPSLAWQIAQWSAQCAMASARAAGDSLTGFSRRLAAGIAEGIRYAADHGARIIDLPLDPGTLGLTGNGDPAAAGGSPAERAAVADALSKGIVLVAPAGDDGQGPGIVNYPAAYPGVIAVGAIDRAGHLASFSSTRSRASLTAPGVSLASAALQPLH